MIAELADGTRLEFPDGTDPAVVQSTVKKVMSAKRSERIRKQLAEDRETYSPTQGMSAVDQLLAGIGSGMSSVGRGIGQTLGLANREDIAEARRLDAPLKATGLGMAGNVLGQAAAYAPTAFIPGANTVLGATAIGAGTGLLAPSESTQETIENTGAGAIAGPLSLLIGRGLNAAYQGAKALVQPLTSKGQEQVAAGTLRAFARDPRAAAAAMRSARPLVPGSQPTMAQASMDPGIAQLERTLVNNPETGPLFASRFADQRAARQAAIQGVAGTDAAYTAAVNARSAGANYSRAMAEGIDNTAAKMMKPQIASLMRRPSIQQAKQEAIRLAREADLEVKDFGSIEGLDWLKKGLDNIISKARAPGSSIGDAKLRAVVQTKQDLMSVIEQVAPAYKAANDTFAALSRPINSMDVGRELLRRYEPALARYGANTRELGSAYATALEGAKESVKKATGIDRPMASVMEPRKIEALENVARDLARKAAADDLGRAVGSNTAQNLSAQNLLRRTLGPMGLPQSWSESTALQTLMTPATAIYRVGGAEKRIMDRLAQAGLDPQDAAALLLLERQAPGAIGRLLARSPRTGGETAYLPGVSAGLLASPRDE